MNKSKSARPLQVRVCAAALAFFVMIQGMPLSLRRAVVSAQSGETVLMSDSFSDNALDSARWHADTLFSGSVDDGIRVAEVRGRLEVGPLRQASATHYNGFRTAVPFEFTNAYARVQVPALPPMDTQTYTMMSVGINSRNYYRIAVYNGKVGAWREIGGIKRELATWPYDAVAHQFLRIRHEQITGHVVFETAPSTAGTPGTWTVRHRDTWDTISVPIDAIIVDLKGGTSASQAGKGTAVFDNFRVARLTTTGVPPSVRVTAPFQQSSYTVPASLTLAANASDDGTVSAVEFFVNGQLIRTDTTSPYTAAWSTSSAGSYTITARARDNSGLRTTSNAIVMTVHGSPGTEDILHRDTFNDNALDAARWMPEYSFTGASNPAIPIAEIGRRLEIGPLLDASTAEYNGVTTAQGVNFEGASATVQLVKAAAGANAFSFMSAGADANNYYRLYVSAGNLVPLRRINGAKQELTTVSYSPTSHRYLRIAHDASRHYVVFQASPTAAAGSWTELWSEPWNAAVARANMRVELKAGTSGNSPERDTAAFDNFRIARPNLAQPTCAYSVDASSFSVPAERTAHVVAVATGNGCAWSASSNASWISITSPASGTSNGTAGFTVQANTGGGARTGSLTIAGRTVTVTQAGVSASCSYSVSPTSVSAGAAGMNGTIAVTAGEGCAWTAVGGAFVEITGGSNGAGSGSVAYSVENNTSTNDRSTTLTVAGRSITINQAGATGSGSGCVYEVSPSAVSAGSGNETGSLSVSTDPGCAWTATGGGFVQVTSAASGSGPGSVSYLVENNTAQETRQASITVAGRTITFSQAGLDTTGNGDPSPTADQVARLAAAAEQIAALDPNQPASALRMLEIIQEYNLVADGLVEYFPPSVIDDLRQELALEPQGGSGPKRCSAVLRGAERWQRASSALGMAGSAFGAYSAWAVLTPHVHYLMLAAAGSLSAAGFATGYIAFRIRNQPCE